MIRPTLRQLTFLIALEDEKSFSKAADACLVTQSTMSAGIKELETLLGQPMVNRKGRSISLTPLGAEIAAKARNVIAEVDSLVLRARQMQAPLSGPLRLGVIPTIAPYLLPQILPLIQQKFPALELQLHEDMSARLVDSLHKGKLDGAIMAFPYDTGGMIERVLFEEPFYLAAPKDRPRDRALPDVLSLKDLKPEELLLLEDGHCLRDHALAACKLQLPKTRKIFSATSLATLIQMVGHGYGVTLLPGMVANSGAIPDNIRLTPFKAPAPKRQIGIAWPQNSPHADDMGALYKALESFLAPSV